MGGAGEPLRLWGFWRSLATFRVRIALNLKGVPYEETPVNLMGGEQRGDAFRAVNPQMVIPALRAGDGPVLYQSLAIVEWLDETYPDPPLLPADPLGRARVRGLSLIVAADSHPLVVPRIREHLTDEFGASEERVTAWARRWVEAGLAALEAHLASEPETGRYCHGDAVTMADLCLVSLSAGAGYFGASLDPVPTVARIVQTCMADDAFARAHPLAQPGAPWPA